MSRVEEIRGRLAVGGLNKRDAADLAYLLAENERWQGAALEATAGESRVDELRERLRTAETLLHETRGLLNHDQAEIVAEMDKVRERIRVQWEEARAERAERIAEHEAENARLRAQLDTVRERARVWESLAEASAQGRSIESQLDSSIRYALADEIHAALNQGGETNGDA